MIARVRGVFIASAAGVMLAGCIPQTLVRYEVDAPGTRPRVSNGVCGAGAKLINGAEMAFEGAQISYGVFEHSEGLTFHVSIRLAADTVALFKQTEVRLSAPGLADPLVLSATEIVHEENKAKTVCTRPAPAKNKPFEAKNLLGPAPPVCEPEYIVRVRKSQPIDSPLRPAPNGPQQVYFPVPYSVSYELKGRFPTEFSIDSPLIEVNQKPVPKTTLRFRRNAEFIMPIFNC